VIGGALLLLVARAVPAAAAPWPRRELALVAGAVAVYQLAFFAAVKDTGVAVGTIVALGSAPTLAGAFEWVLERRAPSRAWALATALALAGVTMLAGGGASVSAPGVLLAIIAGASYAAYTLSAKRMLQDGHAPETVMAVAFGLGALLLAPVLAGTGAGWLTHADGLGLAVFLGVVPTALAYLLFAHGLKRLTAAETATLTLAEPLTATGLGILALSERPGTAAAVGAALVLAGLLTLASPSRRPTAAPAAEPVPA